MLCNTPDIMTPPSPAGYCVASGGMHLPPINPGFTTSVTTTCTRACTAAPHTRVNVTAVPLPAIAHAAKPSSSAAMPAHNAMQHKAYIACAAGKCTAVLQYRMCSSKLEQSSKPAMHSRKGPKRRPGRYAMPVPKQHCVLARSDKHVSFYKY